MSLAARRALYITFIAAFLVIAPLAIIYASGYKIRLNRGLKIGFNLEKTGMLVLDSKPRGAKVYVNGEPQQLFLKKFYSKKESFIVTPVKIKNLLPGEYRIKMELADYWDWGKKLTVSSGASTYAEDIYLFKKELPLLVDEGEFNQLSPSPDKRYIAASGGKKLVIFNLANEEKIQFDVKNGNEPMLWSPNGAKIITSGEIFDLNDFRNPARIPLPRAAVKIVKWGAANSNKIYYFYSSEDKKNGIVASFDLEEKKENNIFVSAKNMTDFLVKNENIFYVTSGDASAELNIARAGKNEIIRTIELPLSYTYTFVNPGNKLINLYDKNRQILYLIDPLSYFPSEETVNNIKEGRWINSEKLLYINDFEIWLFDLKNKQKTILTRISSVIETGLWHPSNNYIIYATKNNINTIELDNREKRNMVELIKLDGIAFPCLNEKGDVLYFYAKKGNKKGVYKLSL